MTVERYTQEFERLLAKVGQNDRDGAQARAYLLSDTGKVYTMLAHAVGADGMGQCARGSRGAMRSPGSASAIAALSSRLRAEPGRRYAFASLSNYGQGRYICALTKATICVMTADSAAFSAVVACGAARCRRREPAS